MVLMVVGVAFLPAVDKGETPVFWRSPPTELKQQPFNQAEARSINSSGEIVGFTKIPPSQSLYWSSPTSVAIVLKSGNFTYVNAFSINNSGQIVGSGLEGFPLNYGKPLYWSSSSAEVKELDSTGYSFPRILGVKANNDFSQIVGGDNEGPVYWASPTSKVKVLNNLGFGGIAYSINASGEIVGFVYLKIMQEKSRINPDDIIISAGLPSNEDSVENTTNDPQPSFEDSLENSVEDTTNKLVSLDASLISIPEGKVETSSLVPEFPPFISARWSSPNASVEILPLIPGTVGGEAIDIQ